MELNSPNSPNSLHRSTSRVKTDPRLWNVNRFRSWTDVMLSKVVGQMLFCPRWWDRFRSWTDVILAVDNNI